MLWIKFFCCHEFLRSLITEKLDCASVVDQEQGRHQRILKAGAEGVLDH